MITLEDIRSKSNFNFPIYNIDLSVGLINADTARYNTTELINLSLMRSEFIKQNSMKILLTRKIKSH